jgi:translation initiation factor 1
MDASFTLQSFDPFGSSFDSPSRQPFAGGPKENIHVRMNKQGSRCVTLIEGLDEDLDQKRIAKAMKKAFSCSATVQKDKIGNDVILLQGDQRMSVKEWLLAQEILTVKEGVERLVLHGY